MLAATAHQPRRAEPSAIARFFAATPHISLKMSSPGPVPAAGRARWPSKRRDPSMALTTSSMWIMANVRALLPQARGVDDLGPALLLGGEVTREVVRRAAVNRHGLSLQRVDDLVRLERFVGGAVQLVDDRLRRAGRRLDAEPQHRLAVRYAGFDHGGKLWKERAALGVGDGERDELAGGDLSGDCRSRREIALDAVR